MNYLIDISKFKKKNIYNLGENFTQTNEKEKISFTNYYMEYNDKPFVGSTAECHFSRLEESRWEVEILKMKAAGINIISTYLFWIHHEEIEGEFDFSGRRNIRKFVELCKKHNMKVIVRVGPFAHGEARNGGLPDWLYGKPYQVRSLDQGFLDAVRKIFKEYARELKGLFFKDNGPIIAVQVDNEYMHSSAPWEFTTGISNEWVNGGHDKEAYMNSIKSIMKEVGLEGAFYTATSWGGAIVTKDIMPLWGGYSYRPWIFYSHKGDHPCTEEYIYQDFHNNNVICTNDFKPSYQPETRPYLCCEMGGGMMCSYYYRFTLPFKSVDAMANIKLGSGCNLLGYYMFHGGNNPKSKLGVYLNEGQVCKVSYDYQAALGEYGQVRESYKRLKNIHYFLNTFKEDFAPLVTTLPEGASNIDPYDLETLRYSIRSDGNHGYLFINNFQDHAKTKRKENIDISVKLKDETITFKNISIDEDENAILPFNLDLNGIKLKWGNAQLLTKIKGDTYIFFTPKGLDGHFEFESGVIVNQFENMFEVKKDNKTIYIVLLNREDANNFYLYDDGFIITEATPIIDNKNIRFISHNNEIEVYTYPHNILNKSLLNMTHHVMGLIRLDTEKVENNVTFEEVSKSKYIIKPTLNDIEELEDLLLQIDYQGDIAYAYIGNTLINDNFSNGQPFEISLKDNLEELKKHGQINLTITPKKEGVKVVAETAMAARNETFDKEIYGVKSVNLVPIYKIKSL